VQRNRGYGSTKNENIHLITKNGRHETLTAEMETREVAKMEKTEKYKNV
jgi:hypothetical protein